MNFWVITDTHLGHQEMMEYCGRPRGFEETILKNTREIVQPEDVLIHIGDFCIRGDLAWHLRFMQNCRGRRWLVRGNHDQKTLSWYLSYGWDCVVDELALEIFGKRVVLSHKPVSAARDDFDINIHGHLHNTGHHPECETTGRHRLLYIEHDYRPVKLRRLVEN